MKRFFQKTSWFMEKMRGNRVNTGAAPPPPVPSNLITESSNNLVTEAGDQLTTEN